MNEMDWTDLYEVYADRVYRYMRYRAQEVQDAEDLTGAVFERAMAKAHTFDEKKGSFEVWLFTIARNQLRDHWRKMKRRPMVALEKVTAMDAGATPEQAMIAKAMFDVLRRSLSDLTERELQIVSLRYAGELRNVDIAGVMHLSEKNVGVILCRALKKLRQHMTKEEQS